MANDDCDRNFEKALAHQLRFGAPAAADSGAQNPVCPDAEILAAYHERSLSLEELASWNTHIAACARCQEILAQLELTDDIPVAAGEEEFAKGNIFGVREPHPAHVARAAGEFPTPAAQTESPVVQASPRFARAPVTPLAPRNSRWLWVAPAGAIAAGLLVWVAVHERPSVRAPLSPTVEIAANREHTPMAPAPPSAKSLAPTPDATTKEPAPRRDIASAGNHATRAAESPENKFERKIVPVVPPGAPVLSAATLPTAENSGGMAPVLTTPKQAAGSELPMEGKSAAKLDARVRQATAPPPSKPAMEYRAAAPAPLPRAEIVQQQQTADSVATSSTDIAVTANLPSAAALGKAKMQDAGMIFAPGGKLLWRVGSAGRIEFSAYQGAAWTPQTSGVTVDLLAGFAPSEKVCWIVGRAGTILRTTDGGKHWEKIASPTDDDLGGVQATDALHASVSDAANKTNFETSDGGKTWIPDVPE